VIDAVARGADRLAPEQQEEAAELLVRVGCSLDLKSPMTNVTDT
jgi:hypothetical protein